MRNRISDEFAPLFAPPFVPFQFALSEKFLHGLQTNPARHTPLRWYRHKCGLAKIRPV